MFFSSRKLDGRVKTLHPNIHGGILARRDVEHHMEALNEHGIGEFLHLICVEIKLSIVSPSFMLICIIFDVLNDRYI